MFSSVLGVLAAFGVQLLIGMAFATPLYAFSAGLKSPDAFVVIYRVMLMPMFLFSGAFFPITNLPTGLQWVAQLTPLWHGVDLTRMLTIGGVGGVDGPRALVHVAYLLALVSLGAWWSVRRLSRRLVS